MKYAIVIAAGLLASPVDAHDFTRPIIDQYGEVARERMKDGAYDPASPVLTLGSVIATSLFAPTQADPRAPADPLKLAKRALLALKIKDAKDLDLTADEVVEIKNAISMFPPLTILRVLEEIDPASLK